MDKRAGDMVFQRFVLCGAVFQVGAEVVGDVSKTEELAFHQKIWMIPYFQLVPFVGNFCFDFFLWNRK